MTKRKTKRNAARSRAGHGFKICQNPMVHLADHGVVPDVNGMAVTPANGKPFLFAIARDVRTIFASWNINWRSVFQKTMPADRQVHLRVIGGDGIMETTVAVEPMTATRCVTISSLQNAYRVEIGYFQPFDIWHSVATSGAVEMASRGSVPFGDVDLATIPFHVSFQQIASLFGTVNDTLLTRTVSEFQNRISNSDKPNEITQSDAQILRSLNTSFPEISTAKRDFEKIDSEKLARRSRASLEFAATSPARAFQANVGS